ncbi:MAG: lipase family protein [Rickettsiales bacterium]|nr:lipase family protein [Rickettsiales bacterium]
MNVAAYSGKPFQGTEYTFVNSKDNNDYYGSAHVNQEKKQLIFTHRGTDSVNPWGSDKTNYNFITEGFKNKAFEGYGDCTECNEAINFIGEVLKDDAYKDFSIIITGHSLGALLSDITLYHLLNTRENINCTSIVFANPGSKPFLEKVAAQENKNLDSNLYKSISLAINLKGDALVKNENQLGSEWFIDSDKTWPCPSWSDQPICTYAGNNHMLKNIRSAINELTDEQINSELPNGWQLSILTKTIIEEVKALSDDEVEVAKVSVDTQSYDIKFKLDSTGDSESITGAVITIVRAAAPKDEGELATIINALYVKKDGSGGYTIGTDSTDAVKLSCAATLFTAKTIGNCDAIATPALTKKIIEEVVALTTVGGEVEVAKVSVDTQSYDVKFKLDSTGDSESITGNVITIARTAAPTDAAGLATIINALYVKKDGSGGYTIGTDSTDAVKLSCAATLFTAKTIGNCDAIATPALTKKIIEEVVALTTVGGEVEVAKVSVDTQSYDVKFKLDSTGDSESITGNVITIARTAAPTDAAGLATIINALYVKKDGSGGYTIGTDTTDAVKLSCAATLFTAKTVGNCGAVNLPGKNNKQKEKMSKVLEDMKDSTTLNTKNINALKSMDADKLNVVSIETIGAFTKTAAQNPIDMSGNLDKVLEIYKNFDYKAEDKVELSSDDVASSIYCVLYNECN